MPFRPEDDADLRRDFARTYTDQLRRLPEPHHEQQHHGQQSDGVDPCGGDGGIRAGGVVAGNGRQARGDSGDRPQQTVHRNRAEENVVAGVQRFELPAVGNQPQHQGGSGRQQQERRAKAGRQLGAGNAPVSANRGAGSPVVGGTVRQRTVRRLHRLPGDARGRGGENAERGPRELPWKEVPDPPDGQGCQSPRTAGTRVAELAQRVDTEAAGHRPGQGFQDVSRLLQRRRLGVEGNDAGVRCSLQRAGQPADDADPERMV